MINSMNDQRTASRGSGTRNEEMAGKGLGVLLGLLQRQRDELDQVISHLESLATGDLEVDGDMLSSMVEQPAVFKGAHEVLAPFEVLPGEFAGLTAWSACYRFLTLAGKPQGMQAIKRGLIRGGFESRARALEPSLHTAMNLKRDLFNRPGPGLWGLVEWNKFNNLQKVVAKM